MYLWHWPLASAGTRTEVAGGFRLHFGWWPVLLLRSLRPSAIPTPKGHGISGVVLRRIPIPQERSSRVIQSVRLCRTEKRSRESNACGCAEYLLPNNRSKKVSNSEVAVRNECILHGINLSKMHKTCLLILKTHILLHTYDYKVPWISTANKYIRRITEAPTKEATMAIRPFLRFCKFSKNSLSMK